MTRLLAAVLAVALFTSPLGGGDLPHPGPVIPVMPKRPPVVVAQAPTPAPPIATPDKISRPKRSAAARAAEAPKVELPAEVAGDVGAFIPVRSITSGEQVRWYAVTAGLNLFPADMLKDSRSTVVTAAKPGRYDLIAWTAVDGVPSEAAKCVVVVGNAPVPPPPGPGPGPGPDPQPDPTDPIPGDGLKVLILEDRETIVPSKEQRSALQSSAVASFLRANCAKDPSGTPAFRQWDDSYTADQINEDEPWESVYFAAIQKSNGVRPWIVVSNKTGVSRPFPKDEAELTALLKQYAEQ
jgi:hypothetical protein